MFITNNQTFVCRHCGAHVAKHETSSRNHCNQCLYSLHVDIEPGDRRQTCEGLMKPIGLEIKSGKTQIIFECESCGARGKNVVAPDDNQDILVEISTKVI